MENRFAGAQDLGDRRRRRISTDGHDEELYEEFFANQPVTIKPASPLVAADARSAQLLRRVISPRLWRHLLTLAATLIAVGGVMWWDRSHKMVVSADGHSTLMRGATGLLLVLAGQLAFLIGWVRSQSEVDFRGRYRWWKWLATGAFLAGTTIVTGLNTHVPDLVVSLIEPLTGPIRAARTALVLVPTLIVATLIYGMILRDMSRSFWSQSLLAVAVLTLCVRLMLTLSSSNSVVDAATLQQMLLISAWCTFASMLLHCRFVSFVCNDPPAESPSAQSTASKTVLAKAMAEHPNVAADKPSAMPEIDSAATVPALKEQTPKQKKPSAKAKTSPAKTKTRPRKSRKKAA